MRFSASVPSLLLFILLAAAPPGGAVEEPSDPAPGGARAIVEKAIEFHGGDAFEASDVSFEIASKSGTFRVEVRREGGLYRQTVQSLTQEGPRRVTVTNDAVEVTVGGAPRPVAPEDQERWRSHVSARVWFPFLPYGLLGEGVYLHDRGLQEWPAEGGGTRSLHAVKVTFQPGSSSGAEDEYLVWFDPETGRLEQLAYSFAGGLRFRKAFNFRREGGLLFADHENFGVDEEGREVEEVTPELVESEMEPVSTIELRGIEVRPVER